MESSLSTDRRLSSADAPALNWRHLVYQHSTVHPHIGSVPSLSSRVSCLRSPHPRCKYPFGVKFRFLEILSHFLRHPTPPLPNTPSRDDRCPSRLLSLHLTHYFLILPSWLLFLYGASASNTARPSVDTLMNHYSLSARQGYCLFGWRPSNQQLHSRDVPKEELVNWNFGLLRHPDNLNYL